MTEAPERIWIDPGAWEIVGLKTKVEPEYDVPYIRLSAHEAAVAAARKEGMLEALESATPVVMQAHQRGIAFAMEIVEKHFPRSMTASERGQILEAVRQEAEASK